MDLHSTITPKEMRLTVEEIAKELDFDDRRRRVLFFMIGWYRIDYKYGDGEE
jgi:hypothetical protein